MSSNREQEQAAAAARRRLDEIFGNEHSQTNSSNLDSGSRSMASPHRGQSQNQKVYASPRRAIGRTPSEYRMRLERLRIAREPEDIREAADVFLAHHQLPDDADILYKVLRHPTEKVIREGLGQLSSLLIQGRLESLLMLEDRLLELRRIAQEAATHSYVDGMLEQLKVAKANSLSLAASAQPIDDSDPS